MSYAKLKSRLNLVILIAIFLVAVVLVRAFDTSVAKFENVVRDPGIKYLLLKIRNLKITAELARTPAEKQRGLSSRNGLPELAGLLFVFDRDLRPSFWMKEVSFPIDIIWLDRSLRVIGITSDVSPDTFPQTFTAPRPIRYVLEINAGLAAEFYIRPGDILVP